jgi:cyclomaltodextrinase
MRYHVILSIVLAALAVCGTAPGVRADDPPQVSHEFRYKPDAGSATKKVNLAGDFNGWSTTATPMDKLDDGTFTATVKLTPGKHVYKFVLDGTTWINDPTADKSLEEDDGQQGKNSAVVAAAADDPPAGTIEHTFTYRPADGTAIKSVSVAGDFNKWSVDSQPMARGDDGTYSVKFKLAAGSHAYKFVIDGTKWVNDPAADKSLDQPDGNGGANSVVVIK